MLITFALLFAVALRLLALLGRAVCIRLRRFAIFIARVALIAWSMTVTGVIAASIAGWAGAGDLTRAAATGAVLCLIGALAIRRTRRWVSGAAARGYPLCPPAPASAQSVAERPPLVAGELAKRLAALQAELAQSVRRDPLAIDLVDWDNFCRRRVPDLIRATEAVYAGAPPSERLILMANLAADLRAIVVTGESRLDGAGCDGRDHLATLRAHVASRTAV